MSGVHPPHFFDAFVDVITEQEFIGEIVDDSADAAARDASQISEHLQRFTTRHLFDDGVKLRTVTYPSLNLNEIHLTLEFDHENGAN